MLHFIHTYSDNVFPALLKSGLWREGDGLKLMHKPGFQPPYDFNSRLKEDAPLERLLRELKCLFYIDRLQGGLENTNHYEYDPIIVSHLHDLLGENFLGWQMHEWASNLRSDQQRILALCEKENIDFVDPAALRSLFGSVKNGEKELFLEGYTPEEWASRPLFYDLCGFLKEAKALYKRRYSETNGMLLPADSYYMAFKTEIAFGTRLLLPEVGWQIPNMRVQIAYARGMANGAGIPWGIYYECWQHEEAVGFTIPFALRSGQDEWLEDLLHRGAGSDCPPEEREFGGSSLSLMARALRYAWFSGAWGIAEEYGVCNTFRDLKTAELSPYGTEKKEFLDFTDAIKDPGVPYKPFALVLPSALPMPDVRFPERWYDFDVADGAELRREDTNRVNAAVSRLFGRQGCAGNQGHVLKDGGFPDIIDIIHADTPSLPSYAYLFDLTGDPGFSVRHKNTVTEAQAEALLPELLPLLVDGDLHTAYNKTETGWLVLCMNHNGVRHNAFSPDLFCPEATVRAPVLLRKDMHRIRAAAGTGKLSADGASRTVTLRAGEWLLLEIQ